MYFKIVCKELRQLSLLYGGARCFKKQAYPTVKKHGALAGTRTQIFGFGGQRSIRLNYESLRFYFYYINGSSAHCQGENDSRWIKLVFGLSLFDFGFSARQNSSLKSL